MRPDDQSVCKSLSDPDRHFDTKPLRYLIE
jgi:hypothetical protein